MPFTRSPAARHFEYRLGVVRDLAEREGAHRYRTGTDRYGKRIFAAAATTACSGRRSYRAVGWTFAWPSKRATVEMAVPASSSSPATVRLKSWGRIGSTPDSRARRFSASTMV